MVAIRELGATPDLCCFDVVIKAKDHGLTFTSQLFQAAGNRSIIQVSSFNPTSGVGSFSSSAIASFIQPGDIVIGLGGFDFSDRQLTDILKFIDTFTGDELKIRLMRPNTGAHYRGVTSLGGYNGPFSVSLVIGTQSLQFGSYTSSNVTAAVFDDVILSVFGTRLAFLTNFHRHLATIVCEAEKSALEKEKAGDFEGARFSLSGASYGNYTYNGLIASSSDETLSLESMISAVVSYVSSLKDAGEVSIIAASPEQLSARASSFPIYETPLLPGVLYQSSSAWRAYKIPSLLSAAIETKSSIAGAASLNPLAPASLEPLVSTRVSSKAIVPLPQTPFGMPYGSAFEESPFGFSFTVVVVGVSEDPLLRDTLDAAARRASGIVIKSPDLPFTGIGDRHAIYRGVHWARNGPGFYVLAPGSAPNTVSTDEVIGYTLTASEGAALFDSFAKSASSQLNFASIESQGLVIARAAKNLIENRAELYNVDPVHFGEAVSLSASQRNLPVLTAASDLGEPAKKFTVSIPSDSPLRALAQTVVDVEPVAKVKAEKVVEKPVVPVVEPAVEEDQSPIQVSLIGDDSEDKIDLQFAICNGQVEQLRTHLAIVKRLSEGIVPRGEEIIKAVEPYVSAAEIAHCKPGMAKLRRGISRAAMFNVPGAKVNPFKSGARLSKGSKKGKKRNADSDEENEWDYDDDDEDDEDEEAPPSKRASVSSGSASKRRSGRAKVEKKYADEDSELDDEDMDERGRGDDEEHGQRSKNKFAGHSRRKSAAGGGIREDEDPLKKFLPEDGITEWKIEKFIGIRFNYLPMTAAEMERYPEDEIFSLTGQKLRDFQQLHLKKWLALPPEEGRGPKGWENFEYMVKWRGLSYLHAEFVTPSLIKSQGIWGPIRAKRFIETPEAQAMLDDEIARLEEGREHPNNEAYFDEDCEVVERVLAERIVEDSGAELPDVRALAAGAVYVDKQIRGDNVLESLRPEKGGLKRRVCYLVKWKGLPYSEATWEWADDVLDDQAIGLFKRNNRIPSEDSIVRAKYDGNKDVRPPPSSFKRFAESPSFKNGRVLRDYQLEGLNWMAFNWHQRRNCILADEMGLGKTIQSVSIFNYLYTEQKIRGPFLVIAPLSTLGHWKREFEQWTELNTVYYHDPAGGNEARALIRQHEWFYGGPQGQKLTKSGIYKFNVIITSYNVFLTDFEHFAPIRFRHVIVDEAHALKNRESQLQQALQALKYDSLMLLTGTPLQNDTQELWALLKLIKPDTMGSLESFTANFGDLKTSEQVAALQKELQPIMLRRVKEDVEKSIPPKEETLINVELTRVQKQYYRAIFERNRTFFSRGAANGPPQSLMSIEMELRKCCNHPFLLRNCESREAAHCKTAAERSEVLINCSGKMVLLDKLLPKLRDEGHRVLIFSQFKGMLNILEEFLRSRNFSCERIDGSIRGNDRQAAIDRYNAPGSNIFAFILSTKAGGQGINLTAADTVIIFDSDWNPQNDVQAMARAHRIGQTRDVRIYRLVTVKTYEAEMFKRSSKKLGLSQAVFESSKAGTGLASASLDGEDGVTPGILTMDKDKIEALLRYGAYAVAEDDEAANAAEIQFASSSIDNILNRAVTVRYDSSGNTTTSIGDQVISSSTSDDPNAGDSEQRAAKNPLALNLSRATFKVDENEQGAGVDLTDPSFWEKVLGPKPAEALQHALNSSPSVLDQPEKIPQWVADLTAILDDVHMAKENNETHDAKEAVLSILIMLEAVGKRRYHPLSPLALAMRSIGTTEPPLPPPSTSLVPLLSSVALSAANQRSEASAGRAAPPDVDEDCTQHDGTLADFASWWYRKMESSNRHRKRRNDGSGAGLRQTRLSFADDSAVKKRGRGRAKKTLEAEAAAAAAASGGNLNEEDEAMDGTGANAAAPTGGAAAPAGADKPAPLTTPGAAETLAAAEALHTTNPLVLELIDHLKKESEGEREAMPQFGLPSVSGLRLRFSPWTTSPTAPPGATFQPGLQYGHELQSVADEDKRRSGLLSPAAAAVPAAAPPSEEMGDEESAAAAPINYINPNEPASALNPNGLITLPSGATVNRYTGYGCAAIGQPYLRGPTDIEIPWVYMRRTGCSRAQVLAAVETGVSLEEYIDRQVREGHSLGPMHAFPVASLKTHPLSAYAEVQHTKHLEKFRHLYEPSQRRQPNQPVSAELQARLDELKEDREWMDSLRRPYLKYQNQPQCNDPQLQPLLIRLKRAQTRALASWHMRNRVSSAIASKPVLPPPRARPAVITEDDFFVPLSIVVQPLRLLLIYAYTCKKAYKPDRIKGPRMFAPQWVIDGKVVDVNEENKRLERRAVWQNRKALGPKAKKSDENPGDDDQSQEEE